MLYTDLLRLWDESVQAADSKNWAGCLEKLAQISEPTSRTLFNMALAHLAMGNLDSALKALDYTLAKDERLVVAFFQRSAVMMQMNRWEESLSDCIWAQKHMRGNMVIDYSQLGLRFKLYNWMVLYNAAAVYCRMGQWEQARDVLVSVSKEQGGGRGVNMEAAMDSVKMKQLLSPLFIPEGLVFRPRKQEVEQLKEKDFLGKSKVISSMIPNDDFGGFEPLRLQKPGYYEPRVDGAQDSRYMRMQVPYMAQAPGQLTVPGGAMVFLFGEEDRDGMANIIFDGQRGLVPVSLLEPVDIKATKGKKGVPSGIPLPPQFKPPTRPKLVSTPTPPPRVHPFTDAPPPSETPPPSYATVTPSDPATSAVNTDTDQFAEASEGAPSSEGAESYVLVKVHFRYTVALSLPPNTSHDQLKKSVALKLGQPSSNLRLRCRHHGSKTLVPLEWGVEAGLSLQEVSEAGRLTLWCQKEDPLANRPIHYQMVALYDYNGQGPEDLEFNEGDTIDVLGEVNESWLEGHCSGNIGIFPACFAYRENMELSVL